jgi:hypothetical protein
VIAVSSLPPPSGIAELADALAAHRGEIDLPARRLRSRRMTALRELVAEHGESALRALGGRREAERLLAGLDPGLDVLELVAALHERTAPTPGDAPAAPTREDPAR